MQVERKICGHKMHYGGTCNMEPDHRGRHCSQAWQCEGCGKMRRGTPAGYAPDEGGPDAIDMKFCFMCVHNIPSGGFGRSYSEHREPLRMSEVR